jgi:hypothetical protein
MAITSSLTEEKEPTFGWTPRGRPVHDHWLDYVPDVTYHRLNKRLAVWITKNIGTMTCFWVFCFIAILGLPAVLVQAHVLSPTVGIIGSVAFIVLVQWVAQSFLQLVLLPSLMVGQNLQNAAADARAEKTFNDVQTVLDLLDCHTQEGLGTILGTLEALRVDLEAVKAQVCPPGPTGAQGAAQAP